MPKSLISNCVQLVQSLRTAVGTSSASLSTVREYKLIAHTTLWLNTNFTPRFIPEFYPPLSPTKIAVSPPVEQDFYPLSTAPTITATKEKEERN